MREMAARVAAAHTLDVEAVLTGLLTDDVARVRASAARALGVVGHDIEVLTPLLKDPDIDVRRGAQQAIDSLRGSLRGH